jgi:hypothetical protein
MNIRNVNLVILFLCLMLANITGLNLFAQNEIPTDSLKLWFRADRAGIHSDNKVSQWNGQSGDNSGWFTGNVAEVIVYAKATLQYVLGMTSNIYAIRGEF